MTLSITFLLSALDISVISTALPTIVDDLDSSDEYVWIPTIYFLMTTSFQPLYGQAANILGRRPLTIGAVIFFAIGSAICGAAPNTAALIAGRAVQGLGGAGINVMIEIIVCDLVPLRERGKFMGIVNISFAVAIGLGPVIGGLMTDHVSWRWIFYMNLPIAGVSLVLLFLFLQVPYRPDRKGSIFKRLDWGGNALLVASVIAILIALTWGGTRYSWGSCKIVIPLVLGGLGLTAFIWLQTTDYHPEPTMPIRMFSNRTSLGGFVLTFLHSIVMYQITYYLPLYFQAVLEATPTQSGVYMLPTAICAMPFAISAGVVLSAFGRYRPIMFAGCICLAISFGLFSRLGKGTDTGYWLGIQFIESAGVGFLLPVTLPAIQAPLTDDDTAVITATWGFLRSFGGVWGLSIPSAVFNSRVNQLVKNVDSPELQDLLKDGGAYEMAGRDFMQSLNEMPIIKQQVKDLYVSALKLTWQVGIAFCVLAFLVTCILKDIPLREKLGTDYHKDERSEISSIEVALPIEGPKDTASEWSDSQPPTRPSTGGSQNWRYSARTM